MKEFNSRYFDLFKVNLFLMFQTMKEYRANLYSVFLIQIIYVIISYFVSFIVAKNFGDVIGWSFVDFLIYQVLIKIIYQFIGFFIWGKSISYSIINSQFNNHLVMPLNIKLKYYFHNLSSSALIYFLFSLFELFVLLIFFNEREINLLVWFLLVLILIVYQFLFHQLIETLGFYYKKLDFEILKIFYPVSGILSNYPINFFKLIKFKFLLFIFFHSILVLFLFPNNLNISRFDLFFYLFMAIFIYLILFLFNWKIGLKKYEAFG